MPIKRKEKSKMFQARQLGATLKTGNKINEFLSSSLLLLDGAPFRFNYRLNSLIGGLALVLLLLLTLFAI